MIDGMTEVKKVWRVYYTYYVGRFEMQRFYQDFETKEEAAEGLKEICKKADKLMFKRRIRDFEVFEEREVEL